MASARQPTIEDVSVDELEIDPYPSYAQWRREKPVAYFPQIGAWIVTRWEHCEYLGKEGASLTHGRNEVVDAYFGPNILTMDGDPHRRIRAAVDAPLRPRAVSAYIAREGAPVARDYVSRISALGSLDTAEELLQRVSVRVIGNILGMRSVDDLTLQRWFQHLSSGSVNLDRDPDVARRALAAKAELDDFTVSSMRELVTRPDDSILSHLIHTDTADGSPRSFDDIIGTLRIIVLGGFQEPGHAAAAALLGLLSRPEQAEAVYRDPALIPAAIHEGLRWIAPFGSVRRTAAADIAIGDAVIPAGDAIWIAVASANHDEARYDDGGRFDLFRPRQPVASFGYGQHFCAGHFVGRELEKVTLEAVFAQLPAMRLDPEIAPEVRGFAARGVTKLPTLWDAA